MLQIITWDSVCDRLLTWTCSAVQIQKSSFPSFTSIQNSWTIACSGRVCARASIWERERGKKREERVISPQKDCCTAIEKGFEHQTSLSWLSHFWRLPLGKETCCCLYAQTFHVTYLCSYIQRYNKRPYASNQKNCSKIRDGTLSLYFDYISVIS